MEHHPYTWLARSGHLSGAWEHLGASVLVALLLIVFAHSGSREPGRRPEAAIEPEDGLTARNVAECFVEAITGIAKSAIPDHSERYVPLLATFFAFILLGQPARACARLRAAHVARSTSRSRSAACRSARTTRTG